MNLKIQRRGHDVKGYMITDNDTLEILSFHKTEESAQRVLNRILGKR